jgi:hypothetical protein
MNTTDDSGNKSNGKINIISFRDNIVAENTFPYGEDPKPYETPVEVKRFLKQHKCVATVRARVPSDVVEFYQRWADLSDKTFSAIVCRILTERAMEPRESGLRRKRGAGREAQEEGKAA